MGILLYGLCCLVIERVILCRLRHILFSRELILIWKQEEKGITEDEMAGWHHRLNGHGFG